LSSFQAYILIQRILIIDVKLLELQILYGHDLHFEFQYLDARRDYILPTIELNVRRAKPKFIYVEE